MRRKLITGLATAAALVTLGGCSAPADPKAPASSARATSSTQATSTTPASTPSLRAPKLRDRRPCPGQKGFTCATLTVPVDYRGKVPGKLKLQVALAKKTKAQRGTLLFLTGGPGQPGVPMISWLATDRLRNIGAKYRFVMIDQRGTGSRAINCPELQKQTGSSDLEPASGTVVRKCAKRLGKRAGLYGTDQTVADLDLLRRALGVDRWVVDGVSYGTFTAARYAIAHADRVSKLVLDSTMPHHATSAEALNLVSFRAFARVLRDACDERPKCGYDPADDLAWLIRHRDTKTGIRVADLLLNYEFFDPTFRNPNPEGFPPAAGDVIGAVHAARQGDGARLEQLLEIMAPGGGKPADYSSGLHVAALCTDQRQAWGDAATPLSERRSQLAAAKRKLRKRDVWPFTADVATGQGFTHNCLAWPRVTPTSNAAGPLPDVPTLLLTGERDLYTPVEWAKQERAVAPRGKLVVVPDEVHAIQTGERGRFGRKALTKFLLR
jgi:pimeloyl-ACP methyl ester carboxylesterase